MGWGRGDCELLLSPIPLFPYSLILNLLKSITDTKAQARVLKTIARISHPF